MAKAHPKAAKIAGEGRFEPADAAAVSCGHGDDHRSTIDGARADGDGGPFKAIERYCVDHDTTLTIRRSTISRNPSATVRLAPRIPRPAAR